MRAIKSHGNLTTELSFLSALKSRRVTGWRRRLELSGLPDYVWPLERVAVFLDGCFWHGCPRCYKRPKTNRAFWAAKIHRNRSRDRRVAKQLRSSGWSVFRIWECREKVPSSLNRLTRRLVAKREHVSRMPRALRYPSTPTVSRLLELSIGRTAAGFRYCRP